MFQDPLDTISLTKQYIVQASKEYNGTSIPFYGVHTFPCGFKWQQTTFFIVDVQCPVIIGLTFCKTLGVVTMHCNIDASFTRPKGAANPKISTFISSIQELHHIYLEQFDKIGLLPGAVELVT